MRTMDGVVLEASMGGPRLHPRPLPRRFYARSAEQVARELLGCLLVRRLGDEVLTGRIVETGTHEQLLARGGLYAQLWARQSGGFLELASADAETVDA